MTSLRTAIVLIGLYLSAGIAGCASSPTDTHSFKKHTFTALTRTANNQIHGNVKHVLQPVSFIEVEGDCLYKFREDFLDDSGNTISEMAGHEEQDLLLMLDSMHCTQPSEPLIKLVGMDVKHYRSIRRNIHALVGLLGLGDGSFVTIERLPENYQATVVTRGEFKSLLVSLKATGPVILSSDSWQ